MCLTNFVYNRNCKVLNLDSVVVCFQKCVWRILCIISVTITQFSQTVVVCFQKCVWRILCIIYHIRESYRGQVVVCFQKCVWRILCIIKTLIFSINNSCGLLSKVCLTNFVYNYIFGYTLSTYVVVCFQKCVWRILCIIIRVKLENVHCCGLLSKVCLTNFVYNAPQKHFLFHELWFAFKSVFDEFCV